MQQAFSEYPVCALRPGTVGRGPMEPQSLPSEHAQIQRRAQGTWQGPVCWFPGTGLLVPRGILPIGHITWYQAHNKYLFTFTSFPDLPNPFTLPSRI